MLLGGMAELVEGGGGRGGREEVDGWFGSGGCERVGEAEDRAPRADGGPGSAEPAKGMLQERDVAPRSGSESGDNKAGT